MADMTIPTASASGENDGAAPESGAAPKRFASFADDDLGGDARTDILAVGATDVGDSSRNARIRARAQQLWEEGGQLDGSHEANWMQAEAEIDEEGRLASEPEDTADSIPAASSVITDPDQNSEIADAISALHQQRAPAELPLLDAPVSQLTQSLLVEAGPLSAAVARHAEHAEFAQNTRPTPMPPRGRAQGGLRQPTAGKGSPYAEG